MHALLRSKPRLSSGYLPESFIGLNQPSFIPMDAVSSFFTFAAQSAADLFIFPECVVLPYWIGVE